VNSRASTIVIGILGVALIAIGLYSVISINDLSSEVNDLEKQTASLEESSSGDKKSSLKEVAKRLRKIEECIPEIQTEVNSMELENIGEEFYVGVGSQVSSYCSDVVYPVQAGE
jgi:hypothetical protein